MNDFKWRHFEGVIILWTVRWYCRYGISYRDLEADRKETIRPNFEDCREHLLNCLRGAG